MPKTRVFCDGYSVCPYCATDLAKEKAGCLYCAYMD